jgi:hypothetical protein
VSVWENDRGVGVGHASDKGPKAASQRGIKRARARDETGNIPEAVGACQGELTNREATLTAEADVADILHDIVV